MSSKLADIDRLRGMSERAALLAGTLAVDVRPFLHERDRLTFRRLPTSESKRADVSVTTSCSVLMALATSGGYRALETVYDVDKEKQAAAKAKAVFRSIVASPWASSELPEANAFTTVLVLRALGTLSEHGIISKDDFLRSPLHPFGTGSKNRAARTRLGVGENRATLLDIARRVAMGFPESLRVLEYPAASTIAYWFVDALDSLGINLPAKSWRNIAQWTATEFWRQVSLLASTHDARKDPIAMAMAACLAARLHRRATGPAASVPHGTVGFLPSLAEVEHGVEELFRYQEPSGIWPKYFPLFHYPDAGSNYCFTYELLEAIATEFGASKVFARSEVLAGLERSLSWCENYRLLYRHGGVAYEGWNSGGQVTTLESGKPEAWATAVVHMFLPKLSDVLAERVDGLALAKYGVRRESRDASERHDPWNDLIDIPLRIGSRTTVKAVLGREVIKPTDALAEVNWKRTRLTFRRSALVFGPPGTSKTRLGVALAAKLGWPFLELNPSDFLSLGLEHIYTRAEQIFDDLLDMSRVVILFDEMDGLLHSRSPRVGTSEPPDIAREFLTTSMLPKLQRLHDEARVVFLMATNHQSGFDDAVKRPGRFDMLLHIGPPRWKDQLKGLDASWFGRPVSADEDEVQSAVDLLREWARADRLESSLDLFTVQETKAFLERFVQVRGTRSLGRAIRGAGRVRFREMVAEWSSKHIVLWKGDAKQSAARTEFESDTRMSKLQ
jgi:hypothetical protein